MLVNDLGSLLQGHIPYPAVDSPFGGIGKVVIPGVDIGRRTILRYRILVVVVVVQFQIEHAFVGNLSNGTLDLHLGAVFGGQSGAV